jgi:hypothetical protein
MAQMEFFPPGVFDDRPETQVFKERWYGPHLLAMHELPLHPPPDDQPTVYRLLFLPTFDQPCVVRLIGDGRVWRAVCKRSDGEGGYSPGQMTDETELQLSRAETEQLGRLLDRADFWDMSSFERSAGEDGSQAILEGARASEYHVVDRWSPHDTPYAELVQFLLGLCPCGWNLTEQIELYLRR